MLVYTHVCVYFHLGNHKKKYRHLFLSTSSLESNIVSWSSQKSTCDKEELCKDPKISRAFLSVYQVQIILAYL